MKYACIRLYRQQFSVLIMCRALQVSRAGFYAAEAFMSAVEKLTARHASIARCAPVVGGAGGSASLA